MENIAENNKNKENLSKRFLEFFLVFLGFA